MFTCLVLTENLGFISGPQQGQRLCSKKKKTDLQGALKIDTQSKGSNGETHPSSQETTEKSQKFRNKKTLGPYMYFM